MSRPNSIALLFLLAAAGARADVGSPTPYVVLVPPQPAPRQEITDMMRKLYGTDGAGGAVPEPAEARKLLDEILAKLRSTRPKVAAASPVPPPTPLRTQTPNLPPIPVVAAIAASPTGTSTINLGLAEYVRMVRAQNDQIVSQALEFEIAGQGIVSARSVFEMTFIGTGVHEENALRNTVQQALQQSQQGEFFEFNERWDAALEKVFETGTRLRVGYHLDDLNNSLQRLVPGGDTFNEFRSFAGVTVTQPLMRGAGKNATRAKLRIAERDRDIAFQVYRREMLRIVAEGGAAYWELAKNLTRLRIFQKSVKIAQELVRLNERRAEAGLIPSADLLEAKVGLSLRQSQEHEAERDLRRATNRVRSFLYRSPLDDARAVVTTEPLKQEAIQSDLAANLRRALETAPEYQIARYKAAKEGIKEYLARNQKKPQLDLKSAYGVNGLDTTTDKSNEDAFTTNHPSWSVGFEMKVPLEGNLLATADLEVARKKKQQAIIEIHTTEVELSNALDSGIKAVQMTARQMDEHVVMVATRRKLLETEIDKLARGLSTSRAVLQRDDDLNRILEDQLEASISHEKAVLALEVTRGTLLERFGMDPKPSW